MSTACASRATRVVRAWWPSPTPMRATSIRRPFTGSPRRTWPTTPCRSSCACPRVPTSRRPSSCASSSCSVRVTTRSAAASRCTCATPAPAATCRSRRCPSRPSASHPSAGTEAPMHVAYGPDHERLRGEFRAYLAQLLTPQLRAATRGRESGPAFREAVRRMGRDGWLTPGWPREHGGRGLDALAQKIILEELWLAEAPFPFVTVNTIGPALIRRGTPAQQRELLPRIASGELNFAVGYTEPEAGTDLAALKTRAVPEGDGFRVNGQKVFTSGAEGADYIWLAARTDP